MSNRISRNQINNKIPSAKPIFFWDTCGILKIFHLNSIKTAKLAISVLKNFEWIADKIMNKDIISITNEIVISEINEHKNSIFASFVQEQTNAKNNVLRYNDFMTDVELKDSISNHINLISVEERLDNIYSRIVQNTYIIKKNKDYAKKAEFRLLHKLPPALVKQEYKDCYIWSSFIDILRKRNPPTGIFYTDNTKDFFQHNGKPFQQLLDDIGDNQGYVINNIYECRGLIP